MRRVAILGGYVDPFTVAHREIAKIAMDMFHIDKLYVIPSVDDYHRKGKTKLLTDEERIKCIEKMLWTLGSEYKEKWEVDTNEIDLKKICEFIDKPNPMTFEHDNIGIYEEIIHKRSFVHTLLDYILKNPNDVVGIVIGSDSLKNLTTWYKWQAVCKLSNYIYVVQGREGIDIPDDVKNIISPDRIRAFNLSKEEYNFISASKVRERYYGRKYVRKDDLLNVYMNDVFRLDNNQVNIYDLGWI